jgi:hypothetical protein
LLGYATGAGRAAALAWLLCWPLVTASLALWPSVKSYAGLSGLIHAGVGVVMAHTAVFAIAKPVAFVLGCGLALKLLTERAWQTPIAFSPDWGFNVVYGAHLSGTLLGLGAGSLGALGAVLTRAKRQ